MYLLLLNGEDHGWYVFNEFETFELLKSAYAIAIADFGFMKVRCAKVLKTKIVFDDGLDDSIIGSLP